MFAINLHLRRFANGWRTPALARASATALRYATHHASHYLAAVSVAVLLCACAGTPSFLSGVAEPQATAPVAPMSAPQAKSRRTRVTSHDVLSEWSTFGIEPAPYKRRRSAGATPLRDMIEEPDYALTISQIMANVACRSCDEKPYHRMVVNASNRHGVPTSLIHAVIQKESGYNPAATSGKRARGLMQVTPETARFVGVHNSRHLYDPQTNIYAGTAYLKYLIANHATVDEVLAAYNAGPGNVRKYKGVPPFKETRRYIRDVKKLYATTSK